MKPVPMGILAQALATALYCGCQGDEMSLYSRLQHEKPSVRAAAVVKAEQLKDEKAISYLIDRLTDKDRSVRFYAIKALEKMTGMTMGYRHFDPPEKRQAAVARWRRWLTSRRRPSPPVSPAPADDPKESKGQENE